MQFLTLKCTVESAGCRGHFVMLFLMLHRRCERAKAEKSCKCVVPLLLQVSEYCMACFFYFSDIKFSAY